MTTPEPHSELPHRRFSPQALKVSLLSLLSLVMVSYLGYATGDEFLFFVFYFIPVGICGWYVGWIAAFSMALLSGASWILVDALSGHDYHYEVIRYGNGFICFLAFAIIGHVLNHLQVSRDREQRARRESEKALAGSDGQNAGMG